MVERSTELPFIGRDGSVCLDWSGLKWITRKTRARIRPCRNFETCRIPVTLLMAITRLGRCIDVLYCWHWISWWSLLLYYYWFSSNRVRRRLFVSKFPPKSVVKKVQKKQKRACIGLINLQDLSGFNNKKFMNELSSPSLKIGPIGQAVGVERVNSVAIYRWSWFMPKGLINHSVWKASAFREILKFKVKIPY